MITHEIKESIETFCAYLAKRGIDCNIIAFHEPTKDMCMFGNFTFKELHDMLNQFEEAKYLAAPTLKGPTSKVN